MTVTPEFSRTVRLDTLGSGPRTMTIEATSDECAALARRFDLVGIESLAADLSLVGSGDIVTATGMVHAAVTQSCVATGTPLASKVDAALQILFSPPIEAGGSDEEVELSETDCDIVFYSGAVIDVGEAVAETLSLSLDPWPRAPNAREILKAAGIKSAAEVDAGPFASLAALKDKLKG